MHLAQNQQATCILHNSTEISYQFLQSKYKEEEKMYI